VIAEGEHLLEVEALDGAGNRALASVAFAIDATPPAIEIGGVTAGATYGGPVVPTYWITDAHPSGGASATLDSVPFPSGGTVTEAGDHLLIVTAEDAAGNVAVSTLAFLIEDVLPSARLSAHWQDSGRVLVGLGCSPEDAEEPCAGQVPPFFERTLSEAGIVHEYAAGARALQRRLRAHWHDVRVVYGHVPGEEVAFEELREATWAGGGLVLILAGRPDADPKLGDAPGWRPRGELDLSGETEVEAGFGAAGDRLPLIGPAVDLALDDAQPLLTASSGEVIAAIRPYGRGRVVTLSFDPERNATAGVAALLVQAIGWASAGAPPSAVAGTPLVATIDAQLASGPRTSLALTATLPPGVVALTAPGADSPVSPTWLFDLAGGETATRQLVITAAPAPGAPIGLLLSRRTGTGWTELAATDLELPFVVDPGSVRASATARVAGLEVAREDRHHVTTATSALARALQEEARGELEKAIRDVLRVVDALRLIESVDTSDARAASDALLRSLELQSVAAQ
jgi:hypothetical protein